jgi:hypothetical protein
MTLGNMRAQGVHHLIAFASTSASFMTLRSSQNEPRRDCDRQDRRCDSDATPSDPKKKPGQNRRDQGDNREHHDADGSGHQDLILRAPPIK